MSLGPLRRIHFHFAKYSWLLIQCSVPLSSPKFSSINPFAAPKSFKIFDNFLMDLFPIWIFPGYSPVNSLPLNFLDRAFCMRFHSFHGEKCLCRPRNIYSSWRKKKSGMDFSMIWETKNREEKLVFYYIFYSLCITTNCVPKPNFSFSSLEKCLLSAEVLFQCLPTLMYPTSLASVPMLDPVAAEYKCALKCYNKCSTTGKPTRSFATERVSLDSV